jgi:hypothetical protein
MSNAPIWTSIEVDKRDFGHLDRIWRLLIYTSRLMGRRSPRRRCQQSDAWFEDHMPSAGVTPYWWPMRVFVSISFSNEPRGINASAYMYMLNLAGVDQFGERTA